MAKVQWIDRELLRSPMYYCLCTTEKEYLGELARLNVKYPDKWVKEISGARTHFLDNDKGSTCAIVCLPLKEDHTILEHEALLVHEAVHIFQEICDTWGEKKPSPEFEAYSIQRITLNLLHQFHKKLLTADKKLRTKINKLSKEMLLE